MYNTNHAMRAKRTACAIDCSRASARLSFYFLSPGQLASRKNGTGRLLFSALHSRLMERSLFSCFLVIFFGLLVKSEHCVHTSASRDNTAEEKKMDNPGTNANRERACILADWLIASFAFKHSADRNQ
jgi:hypothetical protein